MLEVHLSSSLPPASWRLALPRRCFCPHSPQTVLAARRPEKSAAALLSLASTLTAEVRVEWHCTRPVILLKVTSPANWTRWACLVGKPRQQADSTYAEACTGLRFVTCRIDVPLCASAVPLLRAALRNAHSAEQSMSHGRSCLAARPLQRTRMSWCPQAFAAWWHSLCDPSERDAITYAGFDDTKLTKLFFVEKRPIPRGIRPNKQHPSTRADAPRRMKSFLPITLMFMASLTWSFPTKWFSLLGVRDVCFTMVWCLSPLPMCSGDSRLACLRSLPLSLSLSLSLSLLHETRVLKGPPLHDEPFAKVLR